MVVKTHMVRGARVVLDEDLAALFGVETKRLNEQVRRNSSRFDGYAMQLGPEEFAVLRSQIATSRLGHGGRRRPPWVFTEHGVVMAATVLNSDPAIAAMRLVVEVFVQERRKGSQLAISGDRAGSALPASGDTPLLIATNQALIPRLQQALEGLLDSVIDHRSQATLREEAQEILASSIRHLKDRLNRPGLENDEIAARAAKLLAEAEASKAIAAKTRAEAEEVELRTLARKLLLVIEAERALAAGDLGDFLAVLEDLGRH